MPRENNRIRTSSLLLLETPYEKLDKSHKTHDHNLIPSSYNVNSMTDNLNKYKLRVSRPINDNVLSSKASDSQHKIMIVDDNQEIARLFAITLQDNGFVVNVFNDPLSALANYKAGIYDLLLLDIRMPGMNGYELYQKIRDIDDKAEVCFISAYEEFRHDFKRLFPDLAKEVDCFVTKPIEMHNLVEIVKSKLNYN
jgi:CheY-like chemotaxis protein